MGMLDTEVLTSEQKSALREYKYRGGDNSLTYKYVLSPMAQYLVDNVTPTWIAPNMITVIGLMFQLFSIAMTLVFDPTLTKAPKWLPYLIAFCFFVYQTLDNMDGKQARRIGASSPLGLLFDHGCDAMCAGLMVVPLASVFAGGWSATSLFTVWGSGFITFYSQTWEEYYLHEMWLPIFNGPSEGLIMIIMSCCTSGMYGSDWWQTPKPWLKFHSSLIPMFPFQLLIAQVLVLVVPSIVSQIVKVLYKLSTEKGISRPTRIANLQQAILALVMVFSFVFSSFIWCFISESAISRTPIQTYIFNVSVFVEMVTHLMFMHVTSGTVNSVRRFTVWSSLLLPLNSFYGNYGNVYAKLVSYVTRDNIVRYFTVANQGKAIVAGTQLSFKLTPLVDEVLLINILSCLAFVTVAVKGYRMVTAMSDALNIYCFVLGKRVPYQKDISGNQSIAAAEQSNKSEPVDANIKEKRSRAQSPKKRSASPLPKSKRAASPAAKKNKSK